MNYPDFPISMHIDSICETLKSSKSHFLILTAETGAGKSTVLPLGLLNNFSGNIIVTQPRRLAAVGVANRVASLCGETCGKTVGYKVHLENKTCKETRLEFVTEAILLRNLSDDPFLENYNVVVIDEFHERTVNTDLNLSFVKEAVSARDDLFVIIMSATLDTEKLKNFLGGDAVPVMKIPGRTFPVDVFYENKKSIENVIINEVKKNDGDVLVFLPGISDIKKTEENLLVEFNKAALPFSCDVFILHSSITLEEQKKILNKKPDDNRRIILSSSIAETSVTVPDITCVVDSGLSRVARMNAGTLMTNLVTEIESEFSSEQRKGRAGRLCRGRCIRMWNEAEPRVKNMIPEILRTDLLSFSLECISRGESDLEKLDLLDRPPKNALKQSLLLLTKIGLCEYDEDRNIYSITEKGKAALTLPLDLRLSSIALCCGAEKINLVSDVLINNSPFAKSSSEVKEKFISDIKKRLTGLEKFSLNLPKELIMLEGFPDRLCKRISEYGAEQIKFQFPYGRKASLKKELKTDLSWIIALDVMQGTSEGIIYSFENISESLVEEYLKTHSEVKTVCTFENGKLLKSENRTFGEIVLSSKKINPEEGDLLKAWIFEVKEKGIESLPLTEKIKNFLTRVKFFYKYSAKKNIDEFDFELSENVEKWLTPFFTNQKNLSSEIVYDALYWFLEGSKVDKEVPEVFELENKKRCKIKYEESVTEDGSVNIQPVIEIIIQRIFGCFKTPQILGQKVLLRLLSPASRPLQITKDLENFWENTWPEICKEMKGRYPKHNWDYRISDVE